MLFQRITLSANFQAIKVIICCSAQHNTQYLGSKATLGEPRHVEAPFKAATWLPFSVLSFIRSFKTNTNIIHQNEPQHRQGANGAKKHFSPPTHHQINKSKICQDIALTETKPGVYLSPRNSAIQLRVSE